MKLPNVILLRLLISCSLLCVATRLHGEVPCDEANKIEDLIESLRSNDRKTRARAADDLKKFGPQIKAVVPGLIRHLNDMDPLVRTKAARTLGYIGQDATDAIPALVNQLRDENSEAAEMSAFALGQMGKAAEMPVLKELEGSMRTATVQKHCIWVLGTLRARVAVPRIIKILESEDADIRDLAQNALGQIGDDQCIKALIKAFQKDQDEKVRREAAYSLGHIGASAKEAIPAFIDEMKKEDSLWHDAVVILPELGEGVVPRVAAILRDPVSKPFVRERCLYCLYYLVHSKGAVIGLKATVPGLTPFLHDEGEEVRELAACVLGHLGEQAKEALPELRATLKDNAAMVRTKVAVAIIHIEPKDEEAFRTIVREISNAQKSVKLYAIDQMGNFRCGSERAVSILIKALADTDSDIRLNAVMSLGKLGFPARAAVPVLKDILKNNKEDTRVLTEVERLIRMLEKPKE